MVAYFVALACSIINAKAATIVCDIWRWLIEQFISVVNRCYGTYSVIYKLRDHTNANTGQEKRMTEIRYKRISIFLHVLSTIFIPICSSSSDTMAITRDRRIH